VGHVEFIIESHGGPTNGSGDIVEIGHLTYRSNTTTITTPRQIGFHQSYAASSHLLQHYHGMA